MGEKRYLFKTKEDEVWEFRLNSETLLYRVVSESKRNEEGVLETEVTAFAADMDHEGVVHFVYKIKSKLYYCRLQAGVVLDKENPSQFEGDIKELGVYLINGELNIFYISKTLESSNSGILCHGLLKEEEFTIREIDRINLLFNGAKHYQVEVLKNNDILLLFISNDEKEVLFKSCMKSGDTYSHIGLLYALKGNSLDFHMVRFGQRFHILNLSIDSLGYKLDDIRIKPPGKVESVMEIHKSEQKITDPVHMPGRNTLWTLWKEKDSLICSYLTGFGPGAPEKILNDEAVKSFIYKEAGEPKSYIGRIFGLSNTLALILPEQYREIKNETLSEESILHGSPNKIGAEESIERKTEGVSMTSLAGETAGWSKEIREHRALIIRRKIDMEKKYADLERKYNEAMQENALYEEKIRELKKRTILEGAAPGVTDNLLRRIEHMEHKLKDLEALIPTGNGCKCQNEGPAKKGLKGLLEGRGHRR